jgi:RNA polymerase-interacting CarD/CdnL/TRCF family regulator
MNTTIFLPVNNEILLSKMRSVLSKDEIDRIIDSVKTVDNETKWPENKRQRSAYFDEVLRGNNTQNIFNLASRLHLENLNLAKMGKKPLSCDHNAMLQAEWLIENEFSFVLKIPNEAVREYIIAKLNNS